VGRFGSDVEARTLWGTPALDLAAAVSIALEASGVETIHDTAGCTACDRRWYSHRARGEQERLATSAWLEAP
jgi:copper oxidase (laccase) domain-containing protein